MLLLILLLAGYVAIGVLTSFWTLVYTKVNNWGYGDSPEVISTLSGIFWPISGPIWLLNLGTKALEIKSTEVAERIMRKKK